MYNEYSFLHINQTDLYILMKNTIFSLLILLISSPLLGQDRTKEVANDYEYLEKLYKHLHPELSFQEKEFSYDANSTHSQSLALYGRY